MNPSSNANQHLPLSSLVHPIYRYLWPTPQSIFYPVSHRIPTNQALYAQLYSIILYRYIHIDAQSSAMRERILEKTHQSRISSQFIKKSTNSSTTSSLLLPDLPQNNKTLPKVVKITPSPRFPYQALVSLLFHHLGLLRYPVSASGIDLDSYKSEIQNYWSLTKIFHSTASIVGQEPPPLVSKYAMDVFEAQLQALNSQKDQNEVKCTCDKNDPLPQECFCGYIPVNQREQLHEQYRVNVKARMVYPLIDEHRTPLPFFETTFLSHVAERAVTEPFKSINETELNLSTPNDSPRSAPTTDLKEMVSSVHSILKQQIPTRIEHDQPDEENTSNIILQPKRITPTSTTTQELRSKKLSDGTRSIVLKEFDLDTMMGLLNPPTNSPTPINTKSATPPNLITTPNESISNTKPFDPNPLTLTSANQTINQPISTPLLTRFVRQAHPKHRSKILNTTQYLIFASQLQRERFRHTQNVSKIQTIGAIVQPSTSNVLPTTDLPDFDFSHKTTPAQSFYQLLIQLLQKKKLTSTPTVTPTLTQASISTSSPATSIPPILAALAYPSYQAFNSHDQFLSTNCVFDTTSQTIPTEISGNISTTATSIPNIISTPLPMSQITPSSLVVFCSPEKPEVWGCLLFALGILNSQILQAQAISNHQSNMLSNAPTNSLTSPSSSSSLTTATSTPPICNTPVLPSINPSQPTSLKVESTLIESLYKLYTQSTSSTSTSPACDTTTTSPSVPNTFSTSRFQKEYQTLTTSLPKMASFYDHDIYEYLVNGLQIPTNTFYLPSSSEVRQTTHLYKLFSEYRTRISTAHPQGIPLARNKLLLEQFFAFVLTQSTAISSSLQHYFTNSLLHTFTYPLSSSPTSPQALYHFSFDTDAVPYCYVPKAIQGLLAPASTRPTLAEHRQLISRSFRKKSANTMSIQSNDSPSSGDGVSDNANTSSTTPSHTSDQTTSAPSTPTNESNSNYTNLPIQSESNYPNLPNGDISFNLLWSWRHSTINHQQLHVFQKVNHFQRSGHLTRKDALSKNVTRFINIFNQLDQKLLSKHFQQMDTNDSTKCIETTSSSQSHMSDLSVSFTSNTSTPPSPTSSNVVSQFSKPSPLDTSSLMNPIDLRGFTSLNIPPQQSPPSSLAALSPPQQQLPNAFDLPSDIQKQLLAPNLDILPLSYVFPLDLSTFKADWKTRQQNCTICNGTGRVVLTSSPISAQAANGLTTPSDDPCSCQLWIVKPVNSSRGRGIFITADVETFATPYIDFYADIPLSKLYGAQMTNSANVASNADNTLAKSILPLLSPNSSSGNTNGETNINENDTALKFAETTAYPPVVVQHYINNPLLLHKRKFDLRLYVMVVSFDPLEAYVYNEGYARFAGNEFSSDINDLHGHLTNSSLNLEHVQQSSKESNSNLDEIDTPISSTQDQTNHLSTLNTTTSSYAPQYVPNPSFAPSVLDPPSGNDGVAKPTFDNCKQLFSEWLIDMIETFGPQSNHFNPSNPNNIYNKPQKNTPRQPLDAMKLLKDIDRVILNSLLLVSSRVGPQSNAFELFGYDIMIDDNYRPWLLEVNSSPSMNLNTDIDTLVKPQLMADSISLLGLLPFDRVKLSELVASLITTNQINALNGTINDTELSAKNSVAALSANAGQRGIKGFGGALFSYGQTQQQSVASRHNKNDLNTPESAQLSHTVFSFTSNNDGSSSNSTYPHVDQLPHLNDTINQLFSQLLSNFRTRFYGELPVNIGQFRRIAPNGLQSIFGEQQRFKMVLKKYSTPLSTQTSVAHRSDTP